MNIAVVCIAILASIVFVLGMNVSRLRGVRERAGGPQFPDRWLRRAVQGRPRTRERGGIRTRRSRS